MSAAVSGPPEQETGGRLTIDLSAIQANWRLLAARAAPAECAAVVKADAYGLGAAQVSKALWEAGARTFFVALPFEAGVVRAALPDAVIYVLSGLTPGAAPSLAAIGARPVLGSLPEIEAWAAYVRASGSSSEAAIHIDTGMNRLGLSLGEAAETAGRHVAGILGFQPSLVMSHLAIGEEPHHPLTQRQLKIFRDVSKHFPEIPASLANSAATLHGGDFRFDLCRPGIALYGGNPAHPAPNPMQPVVALEARIVQIRTPNAGETVGYGAEQTFARPSRLAILSIGYADGLLRAAGSSDRRKGAETIIAGKRCPFAGRVSMDLVAVDITDLPPGAAAAGDYATVLGKDFGVDDLAAAAGTIGYEILTRLGPRFARTYKD